MPTDPQYQHALDYLYSFINYEAKPPPTVQHATFNLDRLRFLLAALDTPQTSWPSVVVAGTKGKGSTAAMIEAMLRAAGYRTGLFSSPHLHSWRERIQVNRALIGQADVVRLVDRLRPIVAALPPELDAPTTFELATALAFCYFAEQRVEIAVLEVGLGGRYDTVNVVTPLVSVITPISFDHMATLGPTLHDIAGAKAGIVKPGVAVVSAVQHPEAAAVIAAEAALRAAPLYVAHADALHGPDTLLPYASQPTEATLGLRGSHQVENARVALGAAALLMALGWHISPPAQAAGLRDVRWPGRLEVLAEHPRIVVDGAMNGASATRLREALAAMPHQRLILVLGTSADKDIAAIAAPLVPHADIVILTRSRHPRAASLANLAAVVAPLMRGPVHLADDIPPALDLARQFAQPDDLICVTGSLFVVAAARETLLPELEID